MKVSMIAAMGSNRVIGRDNDLPWHLPDDFDYFKQKTNGRCIIMGRKNWESLPPKFRPLPNRTNIIITRQQSYAAEGGIVTNTLEDALQIAEEQGENEAFIIGGGEIYRMGLTLSNQIYLTEINGEFDGQTTFPKLDKSVWKELSRNHHPKDERHAYSFDFVVYTNTLKD